MRDDVIERLDLYSYLSRSPHQNVTAAFGFDNNSSPLRDS